MDTKKHEVLYIEDDPYSMLVMRHIFRKKFSNCIFAEAFAVEKGIELARLSRPSLILMDLKFVGMDGYEGLKQLRLLPETVDIDVWAVSASVLEDEIQKGLRAGFSEYIAKPMDLAAFTRKLKQYFVFAK